MGVTGLWKLIEPCGKPVPLETLENKILAIDISIWLHQVIKGFQDSKGYAVANAHLLGLFHRLCKLLYYRIKPVFVFDGKVPLLKQKTIAKRNLKRNKLINEAERIQTILLQSLAKEKIVQKALGDSATAELLKISPVKAKALDKEKNIDEIFKLPEISPFKEEISESSEVTDADTSFDESNEKHYYNQNLQAIDVKSKHFLNLPADIRHEILIDIKETRKQSSWGKLHELPAKGNDFSSFQMKRLLKRRQVQESLEEAEKEMGSSRSLTLNELENIFSEEGIIEPSALPNSKHISSDANTRFLLVRDLKKTLLNTEAVKEESEKKEEISELEIKKEKQEDTTDEEFDNDIQKAILMSLDTSAVYDESDYTYATKCRLNKDQRKHLGDATVGLARAYMIEHCGMNDEDVRELLEQSQTICDDQYFSHCSETSKLHGLDLNNALALKTPESTAGDKQAEICKLNDAQKELNTKSNTDTKVVPTTSKDLKQSNNDINIVIVPSHVNLEKDDLFADIFTTIDEKCAAPDNDVNKEILESEDVGIISSSDTESEVEAEMDVVPETSKPEISNGDTFSTIGPLKKSFPPTENNSNDQATSTITEILMDLKKQASEVSKISLSDIKIQSSTLTAENKNTCQYVQDKTESNCEHKPEIPHDCNIPINDLEDTCEKNVLVKKLPDIIEIPDDETCNSSVTHTPSKTKFISQFFKTEYVIKRTPEKEAENLEDISSAKLAKKKLFEECKEESSKVLKEESEIDVAAKTLKENKTHQELKDLASELAKETIDLEKQRNRQERMGLTLSEKINSECMQLLRLFGVPFVVAPMEAEAQCAFFDSINLTNGTITDDSDIWLFGGKTVYKNFFAQNKYVMEFNAENIKQQYKVDRQKLIQLALLVGSDYTSGVNGIGPVTALEIIANFSASPELSNNTNQQPENVLTTLNKFRTWWTNAKVNVLPETSLRHRLRNKLKNIELSEEFPSPMVVEAYMSPTVDSNQEAFSWGSPDVELIKEFTKNNFGWTKLKTDEVLTPVLKKLNEKRSQSAITNYFSVRRTFSKKQIAMSKRVNSAICKMSNDTVSSRDDVGNPPAITKKQRKRKQPVDSSSSSNKEKLVARKTVRQSTKSQKSE